MARSFHQSEEFISFRSFTQSYITSRLDCSKTLRPYLRKRSKGAGRRFLEDLSTEIALEAWRRAAELSDDRPDGLIYQMGNICADMDEFLEEFHF